MRKLFFLAVILAIGCQPNPADISPSEIGPESPKPSPNDILSPPPGNDSGVDGLVGAEFTAHPPMDLGAKVRVSKAKKQGFDVGFQEGFNRGFDEGIEFQKDEDKSS
jgi:hypothetical protein